MKRIFKYTLPLADVAIVSMPADPHILSAGNQREELVVWALVDDNHEPIDQIFHIRVTGHPCVLRHEDFIGTVLMSMGQLVWHVFYVGEDKR